MKTLVECLSDNNSLELRNYLACYFKEWAYKLERASEASFESTEELFHFLILDILTHWCYALKKDSSVQMNFIDKLKRIAVDLERYNGNDKTKSKQDEEI